MDDKNEKKKKESIDEILSDLNGLLNRMPSILDGIKMPEIKPAEFTPAREEKKPEPARPPAQPPVEADKTVVLEGFQGLPEGAPEPEPQPEPRPSEDAGDKTVVIEPLSSLPEGAKAPAQDKLVTQSLGEFMFGEGASGMDQPAEEPSPEPEEPKPAAAAPKPEEDVHVSFETTKDFGGIPDIDALMQLSDSDLDGLASEEQPQAAPAPAAKEEPAPAVLPEPAPEPEPAAQPAEERPAPEAFPETAPEGTEAPAQPEAQPSTDELAEFEKQLAAAAPQGVEMDNRPEEEKPQPEPAPEAQPGGTEAVPGFEGLTIEPEGGAEPQPEPAASAEPKPEEAQPLQIEPSISIEPQPEAAQTLQLEPAAAAEPKPEEAQPPQAEPSISLEPQPEAAQTLQLEPAVSAEAQPPQGEPGLSLEPRGEEPARPAGEVELTVGAQPEPGLVLEPASAAVTPGAEPSGEETLVVPPPSGASEDEEKTVIFEAGAAPGVTTRSQAGDLDSLAEKPAPEGLPPERQRSLAFLYGSDDKALCATVLSELDAICLKSQEKPMFIRRASVRECDADANANYILQSVTDSGANGLVCVGAIPQEKIYEIESVFNSGGAFFRHYDSSSFSHSAALDLVMDLILR